MKKFILVIKMLGILITILATLFVVGGCESLYINGLLLISILLLILLIVGMMLWVSEKDIWAMINLFESKTKELDTFNAFLKRYDCYYAYYDSYNSELFQKYLRLGKYEKLISFGLIWVDTPEGWEYWDKINNKWENYCNAICQQHEYDVE